MSLITKEVLSGLVKGREDCSHKHQYGHTLLVCGCATMPGAALLATGAALKSGCGLVTLHSTSTATAAAVTQFPSAMISTDPGEYVTTLPENLHRYSSIGIGPGLGKAEATAEVLRRLLEYARGSHTPMVLDADALNIIASNPDMFRLIPSGSILTPHIGELKRLLPQWKEGDDSLLSAFASETRCVLVKKGFRTRVFTPDAEPFENTTGNAGMAKGGSGDVLTGLLAGLLARGYDAVSASLLGVWIHGCSGDVLTEECTAEAYCSRDLIDRLWCGFKALA